MSTSFRSYGFEWAHKSLTKLILCLRDFFRHMPMSHTLHAMRPHPATLHEEFKTNQRREPILHRNEWNLCNTARACCFVLENLCKMVCAVHIVLARAGEILATAIWMLIGFILLLIIEKQIRLNTKEKSVKPLITQRFYAFLHHGEHGIRTHAPVTRPNAFRVRPLEPLG